MCFTRRLAGRHAKQLPAQCLSADCKKTWNNNQTGKAVLVVWWIWLSHSLPSFLLSIHFQPCSPHHHKRHSADNVIHVFIRCADDSVLVLAGAGCTLVHLSGDSHYLAEAVSLRLPADPFAGGLVLSSSYKACGKGRGMIYFGDTTSTGGGRFVLTMSAAVLKSCLFRIAAAASTFSSVAGWVSSLFLWFVAVYFSTALLLWSLQFLLSALPFAPFWRQHWQCMCEHWGWSLSAVVLTKQWQKVIQSTGVSSFALL